MGRALIVIAIIFLIFFLLEEPTLKLFLTVAIRSSTETPVSIKDVYLNALTSSIYIKELKICNPKRMFIDRTMMDVPKVHIQYDLGSFLKGKSHINKLRLNLSEFTVVKNDDGKFNLDSLKVLKSEDRKDSGPWIDLLELKIGKVIYKDYSSGTPPLIKEFEINEEERYENIEDLHTLACLIVFKSLIHTEVSDLADLDLSPLQEEFCKVVRESPETSGETKGPLRKLFPF